jgi:hypothetical protein
MATLLYQKFKIKIFIDGDVFRNLIQLGIKPKYKSKYL